MNAFIAVGAGAALGAWLRWGMSVWLNPRFESLPLGTLAVTVLGGYCIGFAIAWFAHHPATSPEWRLFFITGFLGALTTFSAFSAEVLSQLIHGRYLWALATTSAHVLGSLLAAGLGWLTWKVLHA